MKTNVSWIQLFIVFLLILLLIRTFFPDQAPHVVPHLPPACNCSAESATAPAPVIAAAITPPAANPSPATPAAPAASGGSGPPAKRDPTAPLGYSEKYSIANQFCEHVIEERQPWNFHKRVISFSMFADATGNFPDFLIHGLRQNLIALPKVYPEWLVRVYTINAPESFLKEFGNDTSVEIVKCSDQPRKAKKMLWRFLIADDPKIAISMIRDLDSRISYREMFAVHEWISSGLGFHALRDHPFHVIPIMGCSFGMRRGVLKGEKMEDIVAQALKQYPGQTEIPGCCADDQNFLTSFIWPKVSGNALSTDSSTGRCFGAKVCHDFPVGPRTDTNFIGNPFKESKTGTEKCEINCKWIEQPAK